LKNILDTQQPKEQADFRSNFSIIDHLTTLNLFIEKSEEYNRKIFLAFIDYTKAFDSVKHKKIYEALKNQGTPQAYIKLINEMYTNLKSRIVTEMTGESFEIRKGVRQGEPLSSCLFHSILEDIFRKMNWGGKGVKINEETLITYDLPMMWY